MWDIQFYGRKKNIGQGLYFFPDPQYKKMSKRHKVHIMSKNDTIKRNRYATMKQKLDSNTYK